MKTCAIRDRSSRSWPKFQDRSSLPWDTCAFSRRGAKNILPREGGRVSCVEGVKFKSVYYKPINSQNRHYVYPNLQITLQTVITFSQVAFLNTCLNSMAYTLINDTPFAILSLFSKYREYIQLSGNVSKYQEYIQISGIHFVTLPQTPSTDSFDPTSFMTSFHTVTGVYSSSSGCLIVYLFIAAGKHGRSGTQIDINLPSEHYPD